MRMSSFITELPEWRAFSGSDVGKSTQKFVASTYNCISTNPNKYDIFITFFLIYCHYVPYYELVRDFWKWNGNGNFHSLDSWLISYDGGFIRRGLSGEVIKIIELITNILPHMIVALISITSILVLVVWTIAICGKKIPIFFIFSPVFFAITARWDVIFSSEYFMLLLFLIALCIIVSNVNKIMIYLIVNVICIIAILMREIFVFSCLPILVLTYNLKFNKKIFSINCLIFFALPIITIVLVGLNTSNSYENLLKTAEYWNQIYRQKIPDFCCFENGYFDFYKDSWLTRHLPNMSNNWNVVLFGFIWLPLIWIAIWYFCGLFTAKILEHYDSGREKVFLGFYYFSTLFSLPLYFLAFDYGRWILLATITSFFATYIITPCVKIPSFVERIRIRTWTSPLKFWQKVLVVTCFGIPGFMVDLGNVYYAAPIWYPLHSYISIHDLWELGLLGK